MAFIAKGDMGLSLMMTTASTLVRAGQNAMQLCCCRE